MTRIYVQRGSGSGSSSNTNRSTFSTSSGRPEAHVNPTATTVLRDEETLGVGQELAPINELVDSSSINAINEGKVEINDEASLEQISILCKEGFANEVNNLEKLDIGSSINQPDIAKGFDGLQILESIASQKEYFDDGSSQVFVCEGADPPTPPVPPPKPVITNMSSRRVVPSLSNSLRIGSSKKAWPVGPAMSSPSHSRPSSPRSHGESEGYNSADEHNPGFVSHADMEKERKFEIDIKRVKGLEVKKMLEDGNCFFRAVADQVYGDSEAYDLIRQMCVDYMERERDHFSQFITEGFTSYCKRKRRDKVYGNNVEIQVLAEMYSRPIHIYSYSTEPINIFQGSYITDLPPIRLSYHQGNHYNSLVDPRRSTIGAGLGFSSLRGVNVGTDQVKAAIKAQQDHQIDNALLAEGRFYSDLELTEKEIERMVMDASRAEYLIDDKFKHQISYPNSSTSSAEPSSSGAPESSGSEPKAGTAGKEHQEKSVLSNSMQVMLSMGFSYLQAAEAYSIFGDDIDSMVCYLVETGNNAGRRKGKAAE